MLSPLDSRYAQRLRPVAEAFSEHALMSARCRVELLFVLTLNGLQLFEPLTAEEITAIQDFLAKASPLLPASDFERIKAIESELKHDVKACEVFLREALPLKNPNLIHFGLTSEDVNNLAYNELLLNFVENIQLPQIEQLMQKLTERVRAWKSAPFPAKTHGQRASPTTAGKEMAVFLHRIWRVCSELRAHRFYGKLNGAVGNFSALEAAFPQTDWLEVSRAFIQSLGFEYNPATTQIEDHDSLARYFNLVRQLNNIVLDLNTDCWLYISYDFFKQKSAKREVGSSTMPHKVNPINFENSEGNLMISNALLGGMADKLPRSRMQRDLSDSTVLRNVGVALGHHFLAISETMNGLDKLDLNTERCLAELRDSPEVLAEPIQTILRVAGIADPYTLLKEHTRGQTIDLQTLHALIQSLDLPEAIQKRLLELRPESYIGLAERVAEDVLERVENSK